MSERNDKPAVSDDDKLVEMRSRYKLASEACAGPYDESRDDIKFVAVPGNQWDEVLKARRGNRRCYEFPKLAMHCKQVINEQKQTRPQGKVRGQEEADKGLAEIMQGLCRNIESVSNAEQAYDIAFETAVQGGYGVWGINTDYLRPDDFDQDIRIVPKRNPFAVKFDPAAVMIDRRDSRFAFDEDLIPLSEFVRLYPDADLEDFFNDADVTDWREKDQVKIALYWYKEPTQRELWALSSGQVVFADEAGADEATLTAQGITVTQRRTVDSHKVFSRLTNGRTWLSNPTPFPSKFIPLIPTWGNIQNIDGVDHFMGLVRPAKDQQRLHNTHKTALIEAVAKAPKAPFILKKKWIEGYENMWKNANAEDYPYLLVNDAADGVPSRTPQAEVPAALITMAGMDVDDMKAATGQHNPTMGMQSSATSGRAINALKQQGATATFNYIDNLVYAIRYTYEILIDMIPKVYDTPRAVRILGEDGGAKFKQLYQEVTDEHGQKHVLNDIRNGKYDVTVTVGASYATQRMEAAEIYSQMAAQIGNAHPAIGPLLAYGVIKNQDAPGMDEIDTALRKVLVAQGLLEPGEDDAPAAPQAPPPPSPLDEAKVRLTAAQTEKAQAEADALELETQRNLHIDAMQGGPLPPPMQLGPNTESNQPPQGGFSLPDPQAQDPQFTGF